MNQLRWQAAITFALASWRSVPSIDPTAFVRNQCHLANMSDTMGVLSPWTSLIPVMVLMREHARKNLWGLLRWVLHSLNVFVCKPHCCVRCLHFVRTRLEA
jgi:hypothetical protein